MKVIKNKYSIPKRFRELAEGDILKHENIFFIKTNGDPNTTRLDTGKKIRFDRECEVQYYPTAKVTFTPIEEVEVPNTITTNIGPRELTWMNDTIGTFPTIPPVFMDRYEPFTMTGGTLTPHRMPMLVPGGTVTVEDGNHTGFVPPNLGVEQRTLMGFPITTTPLVEAAREAQALNAPIEETPVVLEDQPF